MSITLDDNAVDVFKLYDELVIAYSKDIDGYKAIVNSIEAMIAQKEELIQDIKNKINRLIKNSIITPAALPAKKTAARRPMKKFNYAGVEEEVVNSGKDIELKIAVAGMSEVISEKESGQGPTHRKQAPESGRVHQKKATKAGEGKKADKSKKPTVRSRKTAEGIKGNQPVVSLKKVAQIKSTPGATEIKCLYHPEVVASDKGRQLCSSCKWKLINSGLTQFDKEPAVISFLKGEITKFPNLGQSMCPIHPDIPSYNRKTGLCKECQKKAKEIGIQDRHLAEDELNLLRNPAL